MGQSREHTDRALVDEGWWGYSPRAAVPQIVAAAAASALLLAGRWYLDDLVGMAGWAGTLALYGLAVAVWPGLLGAAFYRAVTYTYRLTDRAVLVDRGFLFRPELPIWLADVTAIESGSTWLGSLLAVGWVKIATSAGRDVRLSGVHNFAALADRIREAVAKAKSPPAAEPSVRSG